MVDIASIMGIGLGPTPSGGKVNFEEFSSSGTWTRPNADIKVVSFIMCGGGGQGGYYSQGTYYGGGGGGGGEIVSGSLPVTGNLTITIGAGGGNGGTSQIIGGVFTPIYAYGGGQCTGIQYGGIGGGPDSTFMCIPSWSTTESIWKYNKTDFYENRGVGGTSNGTTAINQRSSSGRTVIHSMNGISRSSSGGGAGLYQVGGGNGGSSPYAYGGPYYNYCGGGGASIGKGGQGASTNPALLPLKGGGGGGGKMGVVYQLGAAGYCIIFWNE